MEDLIKYRKRFNQPIVFNGLQDGVISPTDIDFCFEVDNKYLLIGEVKMKGKSITIGQKLVLQRIVDSWQKSGDGKLSIAYFVTHDTNAAEDVILADTDVESIYFNGQWQDKNIKFKKSVQILSEQWNINKLKNLK
tara:strand:- start:736 stop:1143 length:408 start_codon:yes stop_codon:yes gene_type:complete